MEKNPEGKKKNFELGNLTASLASKVILTIFAKKVSRISSLLEGRQSDDASTSCTSILCHATPHEGR